MSDNAGAVNSANFWEERYQAGQTGWDQGKASAEFETLLAGPAAPAPGRVAVIGCGRGHDARLFARHGFAVTGFDFAPSAVEAAKDLAAREGVDAEFVQADIFALPERYAGAFDYVIERACYCAIDPARRAEYVSAVAGMLRPGGELIALFLVAGPPGGPPFSTDDAELRALFGDAFALDRLEESLPATTGRGPGGGLFARFRRA
ncbi:MAG TPA: methyltransferase domain-containing protein [Chloroflexota bacterium]|nr:methyltransferase domain-containing protein [Chloroflexota bacterium]